MQTPTRWMIAIAVLTLGTAVLATLALLAAEPALAADAANRVDAQSRSRQDAYWGRGWGGGIDGNGAGDPDSEREQRGSAHQRGALPLGARRPARARVRVHGEDVELPLQRVPLLARHLRIARGVVAKLPHLGEPVT